MLYVFAGFPGKELPPGSEYLNAGGLRRFVEVENIGLLQDDGFYQFRKEGIFGITASGAERLSSVPFNFSNRCLADGIDWRWFPENYSFGNGVAMPKTTAMRETQLVDHDTDIPLSKMFRIGRVVDFGRLRIEQTYKITEGWEKYEARWIPGKCPQESHIIHLTTLCFRHELPPHAYQKLQRAIEEVGAELRSPELYRADHFSTSRTWKPEEAGVKGERDLRRLLEAKC